MYRQSLPLRLCFIINDNFSFNPTRFIVCLTVASNFQKKLKIAMYTSILLLMNSVHSYTSQLRKSWRFSCINDHFRPICQINIIGSTDYTYYVGRAHDVLLF